MFRKNKGRPPQDFFGFCRAKVYGLIFFVYIIKKGSPKATVVVFFNCEYSKKKLAGGGVRMGFMCGGEMEDKKEKNESEVRAREKREKWTRL